MKTNALFLTTGSMLLAGVRFGAFAPGDAGWKTDESGAMVLQDGNPVWIGANGNELTVNGTTITNLGNEARTHRTKAESLATDLARFNGIDPDKAREAFALVERVNQNELIERGELDTLRTQIGQQYQTQLDEANAATSKIQTAYDGLLIDNAFNGSKYIADNIAVPVDMFRAQFGGNFTVKDGKVVALGVDGNPLPSIKRLGEAASFDEAVEMIVGQYAYKDNILKTPEQRGTGNNGNGGKSGGAKRSLTRAQLEALSPGEQAAFATALGKGEAQIIAG